MRWRADRSVPPTNQSAPQTAGDPNFAGRNLALKTALGVKEGEREREKEISVASAGVPSSALPSTTTRGETKRQTGI